MAKIRTPTILNMIFPICFLSKSSFMASLSKNYKSNIAHNAGKVVTIEINVIQKS